MSTTMFLVPLFCWVLTVGPTVGPMLIVAFALFRGWLGGGFHRPKKLAWLSAAWAASLVCIGLVLYVAYLCLPLRPEARLILWFNGSLALGCLLMAWGMVRDAIDQTRQLMRHGEASELRLVHFDGRK